MQAAVSAQTTERRALDSVVIRFAGDSGDGMQLTGSRFTSESAIFGNDLATRPDFPAEIRAPAGTLGGVSSFQIHIGSSSVYTAGDNPDVLVAMNPAALKANIKDLRQGGLLICNADSFTTKNLARVGYNSNPVDSEELTSRYSVVSVEMTRLTHDALAESGLSKSEIDRCKNFFALGILCSLYGKQVTGTID